MERNWYVVCTKQQHEKKVTELLTKKGIESYCPFTHVKRKNGTQSVTTNLPLFRSYVFVKATKDEIVSVKKTPSIINTVYWKSEPVVLQQEEITAIKLMAENYLSIKLERTEVCLSGQIGIVEENITGHKHNILTIKPLSLDITIPSLGYRMVGQRTNIKKSTIAKKPSVVSTIAKRLNPALLFGL